MPPELLEVDQLEQGLTGLLANEDISGVKVPMDRANREAAMALDSKLRDDRPATAGSSGYGCRGPRKWAHRHMVGSLVPAGSRTSSSRACWSTSGASAARDRLRAARPDLERVASSKTLGISFSKLVNHHLRPLPVTLFYQRMEARNIERSIPRWKCEWCQQVKDTIRGCLSVWLAWNPSPLVHPGRCCSLMSQALAIKIFPLRCDLENPKGRTLIWRWKNTRAPGNPTGLRQGLGWRRGFCTPGSLALCSAALLASSACSRIRNWTWLDSTITGGASLSRSRCTRPQIKASRMAVDRAGVRSQSISAATRSSQAISPRARATRRAFVYCRSRPSLRTSTATSPSLPSGRASGHGSRLGGNSSSNQGS